MKKLIVLILLLNIVIVSRSQELKTFRAYSAEVAYADKETGKLGPFDVKPVNILVTMQGYTINVYAKSHLRLSIAKINEPELDDIGSYLLMKCVDHNGKVAIVYLYTTKELKYYLVVEYPEAVIIYRCKEE